MESRFGVDMVRSADEGREAGVADAIAAFGHAHDKLRHLYEGEELRVADTVISCSPAAKHPPIEVDLRR